MTRLKAPAHLLVLATAVVAVAATACASGDMIGASASTQGVTASVAGDGFARDVVAYIPDTADGRPVGKATILAESFVQAMGDVEEMALGEISLEGAGAGGGTPALPAAFIAAVDSTYNAEGMRRGLLAAADGRGDSPIERQELEGVPVDVYSADLTNEGVPLSMVAEFFVVDDRLLVIVMSFEGKDTADALMSAAIRAGRIK